MKTFLLVIGVIISAIVHSQDPSFKKNLLGYETGIFSHGLAGLSYSRNFQTAKRHFFSAEISAGIGGSEFHTSWFSSFASLVHLGKEDLFFIAGLEAKRYDVALHNFLGEGQHYKGFTGTPVLGVHVLKSAHYHFKMRFSSLLIFEQADLIEFRPAINFTFGYAFNIRKKQ